MKEFKGICCDSTGCHLESENVKNPLIKIKMFSDYMCAWCYLADTILSTLKSQFDFELEHIGFELHTKTPENGEDMNLNHPNTPQTITYINQIGAPYGLHLCNLPILANTKKALIVGEYAKTVGKSEAYVRTMWKAYMVDGKNISILSEIEKVAQTIGIEPQKVANALNNPQYLKSLQKNMENGWKYDVRSVPTFIINEKYKVVGAQKPEVFQKIFEEILAQQSED